MGKRIDINKQLSKIYYNPKNPGGYGGVKRFISQIKTRKTRDRAIAWLSAQEAYSIHKPVRLRFPRRQTIVSGPNIQLQADLMDVSSHADENQGTTFLLTAVDLFSKKAFVVPLVSKRGRDVSKALTSVAESHPFYLLQTDKGKEFLNKDVTSFCAEQGIKHFTSENSSIKASLVERFNRTLRGKIHRYLTAKDTFVYTDVLSDLVKSYNNSVHNATGIAPNEVSDEDVEDIYHRIFEKDRIPWWIKEEKTPHPNLQPGDFVRISKARGAFDRGFTPNWSIETYVVSSRLPQVFPSVYRIQDLADESIKGTFYEKELQKIPKPTVFRIEKVLRRRKTAGKRQMFVKWLGYPEKFNSWIAEEQVVGDGAKR